MVRKSVYVGEKVKMVWVSIYVPEKVLEEIDLDAKDRGMSRNSYICEVLGKFRLW